MLSLITRRMRLGIALAALVAPFLVGCDQVQATLPDMAMAVPRVQWAGVDGGAEVDGGAVDYYAVAGSAPDDVLIAGAHGTILRWNGTTLTQDTVPTTDDLRGIAVVSPTLAYAVGDHGTILAWNGSVWTPQPKPPAPVAMGDMAGAGPPDLAGYEPPFLTAVWADATEAMVVGQKATAMHFDGTTWTPVPLDSPDDLFGVTKSGGGIIAVGSLGTVATFDGSSLSRMPVVGFPKTIATAYTGPGGTYLAGLNGALFPYPGGFSPVMGLPNSFLRGVSEGPDGSLWVVGWDDVLVHVTRGGAIVRYPEPGPGPRWYYGVYADSMGVVWVVGASGTILKGPPPAAPDAGTPTDAGVGGDL